MRKHSYGKLIGMSWDWLKEMLFRPFSLKKWIMLYIIILFAGYMGGFNFNFNIGGNRGSFDKLINELSQKAPVTGEMPAPAGAPVLPEETEEITVPQDITPQPEVTPQAPPFFKDHKTVILVVVVGGIFVLLILIFVLLWMWVVSNFSFVFIDSVMRNDASLRVPFHRNKAQGNSYFRWNIIYTAINLLVFGGIIALPIAELIKSGIFSGITPVNAGEILSIVLRYVPILIAAGILFFLVAFFAREFVLPIMYKRKIAILKGWGVFLKFFGRNIGEMLKYILMRILLSIIALIAAILVGIMGIIALLIIGGLIGLLGWLIYAITPAAAKAVILIILILIGIPIFVFLCLLFNVLFMPIPVFFRTFSINVLGSIDESLDLFAPKTPEEIEAEGPDEQYRKPMRLVWFAVLFPIIIAIVFLLLAIAVPNFIKAKEKAQQMRQPGVEEIIQFQETPKIPAISIGKEVPQREVVTVYLKNGNSFKAEIEKESEHNVAFKVEGGTFILPRSDILRIEKKEKGE